MHFRQMSTILAILYANHPENTPIHSRRQAHRKTPVMAKKSKKRKIKYTDFMSEEDAQWLKNLGSVLDHGTQPQRRQVIDELATRLCECVRDAAESGDAECMMRLANWYANGIYVNVDSTQAELWRQRAIRAGANNNPSPEETPPSGITPDTDSSSD